MQSALAAQLYLDEDLPPGSLIEAAFEIETQRQVNDPDAPIVNEADFWQ
jgi:hypothetical protein